MSGTVRLDALREGGPPIEDGPLLAQTNSGTLAPRTAGRHHHLQTASRGTPRSVSGLIPRDLHTGPELGMGALGIAIPEGWRQTRTGWNPGRGDETGDGIVGVTAGSRDLGPKDQPVTPRRYG